MRGAVWGLVILSACTPRDSLDNGRDGGDDDEPLLLGRFELCLSPAECDVGLECVELGDTSYCLATCADPIHCRDEERCGFDGFCYRAADYYAPCSALDACAEDAICASNTLGAPHCAPICDVGDLVGFSAVASCPALPAELGGAPSCTPGLVATTTASLCAALVREGAICDEAALRCDPDGLRDSDEAREPAAEGDPDPGAMACLPLGAEHRCLRICAVPDVVQMAPCDCPAGDALCTDPSDDGLAWSCTLWPELADGFGACRPIEECFDHTPCSDNTTSGLTSCGASPYQSGPDMVCQAP